MKKLFYNFVLILMMAFPFLCYAQDNTIINQQNVSISPREYQNLLSLGFTDLEIAIMDKEMFEKNKNLSGQVMSNIVIDNTDSRSLIFPQSDGYTETGGKKMTTTIISISNYYRYKVTVEWKKMPYIRSYDIIGIGKNNNVALSDSVVFTQNYCYKNGNCTSSNIYYPYNDIFGSGVYFPLTKEKNLSTLVITFFYNIKKVDNSTITKLDAYGDYKHATKNISSTNANKFSVRKDLGIELEQSILNYYDSISIAHATWTGSW